jgi:hypothetical protein
MLLEILIISSLVFYTTNTNLLVLLYTSGMYLIFLGILLFLDDADIYVGFLWVIDLGVGLVFFIFILHFTSFLYQKSNFNLSLRYFFFILNFYILVVVFLYYVPLGADSTYYKDLSGTWVFRLTFVDYYVLYNTCEVTGLNLLRDSYFILNSFEFFTVNFSLLFGLLASILMCFMIHRVFNILNFSQISNMDVLRSLDSGFFIKSQNFITQQNTPGILKVWAKSKSVGIR